tara:strand:- start:124 stop:318 length:195 start_codon:yes stop_codon:yes gene_type:complete
MKTPSITLKRTLHLTMKDTFLRKKELGDKDSQALKEESKEWLEASQEVNKHPHVLYMDQIKPNI